MQTKIIFISDRLSDYKDFLRNDAEFGYDIEMMSHAEANRRHIFQNYYDLFIVDLHEEWLAIPPWVVEQAQHHYFFQFLFISDKPLSEELHELLNVRIFKVMEHKYAKENLNQVVQEIQVYTNTHRFTHIKQTPAFSGSLNILIGNHSSIKSVNKFVEIVSKTPAAPCLVRGEIGTGKTLCGQIIHTKSGHPLEKFFIKNCEGVTTNEFLGDLFGVEGDTEIYGPKRKGLLERYADGTLVLKNIEKLPPEVQNQLLLFLENRLFRVLGSNRIVESKTRLVGVTSHDLEWFVRHQSFNSGLYYRLKAFEVNLPPLRDRREDVEKLAHYYMQYYNHTLGKNIRQISPVAMQMMNEYNWPGNVAELKNIMERAVIISTSDQIVAEDLPDNLQNDLSARQNSEYLGNCSLKELEKIHIQHVLLRTNGNKSRAAEILEISRTTLREKMRSYSIDA